MICSNYGKYPGLPMMVGQSKYNTFIWIKERVWQMVNNWKSKFLSQEGR